MTAFSLISLNWQVLFFLNPNSRKIKLTPTGACRRLVHEELVRLGSCCLSSDCHKREEFSLTAYIKEVRSTMGFGIIYVLLGHTGLWAVLLGTNNSIRVLGLPVHYFIAITLGSIGVLIWSIIWCRYANRLEDEIEAENVATRQGNTDVPISTDVRSSIGADKVTEAAK
ncbi:MAG: hypothetical protein RID11_02455 [Roseovarius sp.]|jgi:uncharacterized membrane protein|uniref:hypothetical protein n=1 Tax=Roseovarius sp. TaxID=1486281 RepID=UPI0032EE127E